MEYKKLFRCSDELSPEMSKKAEEELTETPDKRREGLRELRDLLDNGLASENHREQRVSENFGGSSDDFLCRFLRVKKYDIHEAQKGLDIYLRFREKYPELTSDLTLSSVRPALEQGYPLVLPARDNEGRIVFLFSVASWNPQEIPFDDVMRAYIYLLELLLENGDNQVSGFVIVENFKNYSIKQAMSLRPSDLQKMVDMIQGALPIRFKGVHFLYQPWYFTWTYALVRPFLKPKLAARVHVHGWNLKTFHDMIDPNTLPPHLGGSGPEVSPSDMIKYLEKRNL